jgi:hypothetical protein
MTLAALFASTFLLVFFLGLQSLNVNRGHYTAAFFTSFGIGIGQLILYKLAPDANGLEIAAYLGGGPLGIVASMWIHRKLFRSKP